MTGLLDIACCWLITMMGLSGLPAGSHATGTRDALSGPAGHMQSYFSVSPTDFAVNKNAGTVQVNVVVVPPWASWLVTSNQPWVRPEAAYGTGSRSFTLSYDANTNVLRRAATITFDNGSPGGVRRVAYVTLTQQGTVDTYRLSVVRDGPGSGTVTSAPAGISCGSDCEEMYLAGTTVTLTASADAESVFGGWSGTAGCGSVALAPTTQVGMSADTECRATFRKKTVPVIAWERPAPIVYGTPLGPAQLNARADVAGTFVYTPPAGTLLEAGGHQLSTIFTPADPGTHTSANRLVTIDVLQASPAVTWPQPGTIPHGTALGGAQLNATADVAGTFAYTPAAGTILGPGRHTLSVRFTPADSRNYADVTKTASLLVCGAVHASPALLRFRLATVVRPESDAPAIASRQTSQPQTVMVTFDTQGSGWTASSDAAWLRVTGTGTGDGFVTVDIDAAALPAGATGTLNATAIVEAPDAPNPRITIPVALALDSGPTGRPFGQVDTPAQHAGGVRGTVGITGWALDDVGVNAVRIYRNCFPFDDPASCQMQLGLCVVFLGDAAFLAGARPDVEVTYPDFPQAYRAGWGYLLLTNNLPHVPDQRVYGGQGPVTLFAIATDVEGHGTLLGRTVMDDTPTAITLDNDGLIGPFGAIDTPGQGERVSGRVANHGWALTRDVDVASGNADVEIPLNGPSMVVFVDGVPIGQVLYNQCRGDVGNPVPPGLYCNDDVANVFGNPAPQQPLDPRLSNPTRYRNLDAGRGAIGAFVLDTAAYGNGTHSIAWSVTDSAGVTAGIGSRNFIVSNAGADAARDAGSSPLDPAADGQHRNSVLSGPGSRIPDPGGVERVLGRVGFDLRAPFVALAPDQEGIRHVRLPELGRLEMRLGAAIAGALVANGEWRDLPAGSRLDTAAGTFTWAPGPGFHGTYRLAFRRGADVIVVDVAVQPDLGTPR